MNQFELIGAFSHCSHTTCTQDPLRSCTSLTPFPQLLLLLSTQRLHNSSSILTQCWSCTRSLLSTARWLTLLNTKIKFGRVLLILKWMHFCITLICNEHEVKLCQRKRVKSGQQMRAPLGQYDWNVRDLQISRCYQDSNCGISGDWVWKPCPCGLR